MKTESSLRRIIFVLLIGMIGCFGREESLFAASGSIVLTTKEASVDQGEKVHVILSVEADSEIGDFVAYVKYDKSYLKFVKGGSYIQEDGDLLKISHVGDTSGETYRRYAMEFTALKRGKSKVSIKETVSLTELESGSAMSLSSNDVTVTIAKTVASVSPVPKSTPLPSATPKNQKNTKNKLPTEPTAEPEGVTVSLDQNDSKLTINGNYEYRIVEVKKKQYIPAGYTEVKIKINGVSVNAYRNQSADSDFVLLYLQNAEDEFGYYRYDTKEKTMQRYQKESIDSLSVSEWSPDQVTLDHYRKKVKNLSIAVGIFVILLVILSILFVWLLNKKQ